jgi:hypothetical protein
LSKHGASPSPCVAAAFAAATVAALEMSHGNRVFPAKGQRPLRVQDAAPREAAAIPGGIRFARLIAGTADLWQPAVGAPAAATGQEGG